MPTASSPSPSPAEGSPTEQTRRTTTGLLAPWFAALGILLFSANLRTAIVGVSPLITDIRADTHFSAAIAGLLTTIPVLCFGVFSPLAPLLGRRIGIERAIFLALIALIGGILLRLLPGSVALFAGTLIIGAAIAVGNVLLPALIKRDFPAKIGLMTGLYTMTLSAGGALAASVVVPIAEGTGWSWREVLALVAVPAVLALIVWLPQLRLKHVATGGGLGSLRRLITSPLAWWVTLFMGLQSLNYFALAAWLPEIFIGAGMSPADGGLLLALANLASIPACLLAPIIAARRRSQVGLILLTAAIIAVSIVGLLTAPGQLAILWMILLGAGQGASLSLALLVIVLRTSSIETSSDLSGMAQSIGYLLASAGPFIAGAMHDLTGSWTIPLVGLLVLLIAQAVFGFLAGRRGTIPDGA